MNLLAKTNEMFLKKEQSKILREIYENYINK